MALVRFGLLISVGIVTFFWGMTGGVWASTESVSIRYDELKRMVLSRNGYVHQELRLIDAAVARTGSLQRSRLPEVVASIGGEGFQSGGVDGLRFQPVGSVDATISLYRGTENESEELIRRATVDLAKNQLNRRTAEQLGIVQSLYWEVVYTDEMVRNLKALRTLISKSHESAKRRYQRGLLPQSDLMGFEIYRSQLDETIESILHEKHILMIKLKAALGVSESSLITLADTTLPHSHDALLTTLLHPNQTTEMKELGLNMEISKSQMSQLSAKGSPSIDAFGAYTVYTEAERWRDRTDTGVGIRAQFLLYDGGRLQSDVESATLALQSLSMEADYKSQLLETDLKASQEELMHLHELFHRSETRLAQVKQFLQTLMQEYDRGVKDSTDVVTAMQLYEAINGNYVSQKKEYQLTKAGLVAKLDPVN